MQPLREPNPTSSVDRAHEDHSCEVEQLYKEVQDLREQIRNVIWDVARKNKSDYQVAGFIDRIQFMNDFTDMEDSGDLFPDEMVHARAMELLSVRDTLDLDCLTRSLFDQIATKRKEIRRLSHN